MATAPTKQLLPPLGQQLPPCKRLSLTVPILRSYLAVLSLLWPIAGWGSDEAAAPYNLGFGFSLLHFDYREFKENGQQFNRESGYIPGATLTLERSIGAWDISGKLAYHSAKIGYDGRTQAGAQILTSTDEAIYDASIQIGKQLYIAAQTLPVMLYGEIGYRTWERDIHSTPAATGLFETYQWQYVSAGAALPLTKASWGSIWVDAKLTRTYAASVDVDFRGLYDQTNLALGNTNGFRVSLPISFPQQKGVQLKVTPFWEEWSFGRSNTASLTQYGSVVGTIFEPRSETRAAGVMVALTRNF